MNYNTLVFICIIIYVYYYRENILSHQIYKNVVKSIPTPISCLENEYLSANQCKPCPIGTKRIQNSNTNSEADCEHVSHSHEIPPWFKLSGAYRSENKEYLLAHSPKVPDQLLGGHRTGLSIVEMNNILYNNNSLTITNILTCDGIHSSVNGIYNYNPKTLNISFLLFGTGTPIELIYEPNFEFLNSDTAVC